MPADDIEARLARIYAAIGESIDEDVVKYATPKIEQRGNRVSVTYDFMGDRSQAQIENRAHSVIENIASFPNHLKRWCRTQGVSRDEVEEIERDALALKVITDLWNNDKHGYPPRDKKGESGHAPQLAEGIETVAMMGGSPGVSGFVNGQFIGASNKIVITGNVSDINGEAMGMLHDFESEALASCEAMWAEASRQ